MSDEVDNLVARAIGIELRQAREGTGWTRAELLTRLSSDIHPQTLATYDREFVNAPSGGSSRSAVPSAHPHQTS